MDMPMKKILISGFEPFGGRADNPSADAVFALPDTVGDARLLKILLPVEYGVSSRLLLRQAESVRADAVICVGYAAGRGLITPELYARNLRRCPRADNAGIICENEAISPGSPETLSSLLPCPDIVEACLARGINARLSDDCGGYVCNDLFYTLMLRGKGRRGFIHVSDMSREENTSALLCAVEETMRNL